MGFAATVKLTVPLPVPLLDVDMNELLLTAVQLQPGLFVERIKPNAPPLAGTFAFVGLIE